MAKKTEHVTIVNPDADEMAKEFSKLKTPKDIQKSISSMVADGRAIISEEKNKTTRMFQEQHLISIKHYESETETLNKNFTTQYMKTTWQKAFISFHKLKEANSINLLK